MKVYLSYPMSGKEGHGIPRATEITASVRRGYPHHEFIAPHEIKHSDDGLEHFNPGYSHFDYLRADLAAMKRCHAIAMAPGWTTSSGCLTEFEVAARLGLVLCKLCGPYPRGLAEPDYEMELLDP